MEVDFAFHAVAGTIIGEPGEIDFSDTSNPKLERITLSHDVNRFTLKSFTHRLRFGFDPNEESVFLEDAMYRSSGTRKFELALNSSDTPCRISSI